MFYESNESISHESWANETHIQYSNNLRLRLGLAFIKWV